MHSPQTHCKWWARFHPFERVVAVCQAGWPRLFVDNGVKWTRIKMTWGIENSQRAPHTMFCRVTFLSYYVEVIYVALTACHSEMRCAADSCPDTCRYWAISISGIALCFVPGRERIFDANLRMQAVLSIVWYLDQDKQRPIAMSLLFWGVILVKIFEAFTRV